MNDSYLYYLGITSITSSNLGIYFLTEARTAKMYPSNEDIHSRLPRVLEKHICYAGTMSDPHK